MAGAGRGRKGSGWGPGGSGWGPGGSGRGQAGTAHSRAALSCVFAPSRQPGLPSPAPSGHRGPTFLNMRERGARTRRLSQRRVVKAALREGSGPLCVQRAACSGRLQQDPEHQHAVLKAPEAPGVSKVTGPGFQEAPGPLLLSLPEGPGVFISGAFPADLDEERSETLLSTQLSPTAEFSAEQKLLHRPSLPAPRVPPWPPHPQLPWPGCPGTCPVRQIQCRPGTPPCLPLSRGDQVRAGAGQ